MIAEMPIVTEILAPVCRAVIRCDFGFLLLWEQRVAGSNPAAPTNYLPDISSVLSFRSDSVLTGRSYDVPSVSRDRTRGGCARAPRRAVPACWCRPRGCGRRFVRG